MPPIVIYIYTTDNDEQVAYMNDLKELTHRVFFYPANYEKNYQAIKNSPKLRLNYLPALLLIEKGEDGQDTIGIIEGNRVRKWIKNERAIQEEKETYKETNRERENFKKEISRPVQEAPEQKLLPPPVPSLVCNDDICEIQTTRIAPSAPDILPTDTDDGISKFMKSGKKIESHLDTASSSSYSPAGTIGEHINSQKEEERSLLTLSGQSDGDGSQQQHRKLTQKQKDMRSMQKLARDMQEERLKEVENLPNSLKF